MIEERHSYSIFVQGVILSAKRYTIQFKLDLVLNILFNIHAFERDANILHERRDKNLVKIVVRARDIVYSLSLCEYLKVSENTVFRQIFLMFNCLNLCENIIFKRSDQQALRRPTL